MQTPLSNPPKPVSTVWHPELTRLPPLHSWRRAYRLVARLLARLVIAVLTKTTVSGLENFPRSGPALIVVNHLGDADTAAVLAVLPRSPDALGKLELIYEFPLLGKIMDWYGMIWLHRGRPDRRALEFAVQALREGRCLAIAPEGRYTLVRGLEHGGSGAAYVAMRAGVPPIPVALTGTENSKVYGSLRRLRRPRISLTIGRPIPLEPGTDPKPRALKEATEKIMQTLARLLPPEYRGVYGGSSSSDPV